MDLLTFLGYFSGLYFINPDLDAVALVRTATLVHALDAVLCRVIASHGGRSKLLWTAAGLVFGIWALGALFLMPQRKAAEN